MPEWRVSEAYIAGMDSRMAAHVLSRIGALLELGGAPKFNARAYQNASRAVLALGADDLLPLLQSGELKKTPGVGPATLSVIKELIETGESAYLQRLVDATPEGLLEMVRVPGLGSAKVHLIHTELGVETLEQLEEAARDGRLAKLPRFGQKTAERILKGIPFARNAGQRALYHRGLYQAVILRDAVARHPDVAEAVIAGSVRRHLEIVRDNDIVAVCKIEPSEVAQQFATAGPVREAAGAGASVSIRYVDGTDLDLYCTTPANAGFTLWRATGSDEHVTQLRKFAAKKGFTIGDEEMLDRSGRPLRLATEQELFATLGLAEIPPELREGLGEIDAAANGTLPNLLLSTDIRGVLHCHSTWSDGVASIEDMANAARERGWSYIGITDHSEAAFYAGGMKRDKVRRQHDEIDEINARTKGFRVLKGIEADILAEGRLDYDDDTLAMFEYVVGSVHSRFNMSGTAMTDRVLSAMGDPRLTILGHPTGRLLLSREGYDIDIDALIEKALETGTVLELNSDPHRLDLDWRHVREAKDRGVMIEIGPDAHSERGLDALELGVGMARKAWLEKKHVMNALPVTKVLAIAERKRAQRAGRHAEPAETQSRTEE